MVYRKEAPDCSKQDWVYPGIDCTFYMGHTFLVNLWQEVLCNIGKTFGEPSILDTKDLPIKKGSLQSILALLDCYNDKGAWITLMEVVLDFNILSCTRTCLTSTLIVLSMYPFYMIDYYS